MKCYTECKIKNKRCQVKDCRLWIEHPDDLNCTEIAVQKGGQMVLREIAERLHLTPSRIKQIENKALSKVSKTFKKLNIL
jgi:hypothetical protein|tara:strand:+ start:408 stop:647 length:240 start_codon:yes stop_codon:yes gene_type:complete